MTEIFGITISDFFDLPNNLKPETKRNSSSVALWIKSNLHICVAIGLGIFVLVLALCAFLIPINYSSGEIYDKYKSSIFYLDMQGVMGGDATTKNGTGFFINNKGLGVTLYDNLKYCASGQVVLSNSDRFNIEKVVGIDEENNLALIQTDAQNTKYININYDKNVKLGDKVYCLAYSFDDGTKEHQSALAEGVIFKVELDSLGKSSQIQTTATIDDATSGGVVFNEHADAIAITLRDLVSYTDVVNVCIPVRIIKDIDRDVNLSLYDLAARDYSYTISFNSNGGNGYMAPQFIWQDEWTALYENVFTKDGYKFAGWQYNGRIYQDGEQVYNLGSVTLTATWELVSYGITYYLDGGENSSLNVNSFTVLNDEVILYEATKPGYIFINWYQDINCEGDAIHSINPQTLQNYFKFLHTLSTMLPTQHQRATMPNKNNSNNSNINEDSKYQNKTSYSTASDEEDEIKNAIEEIKESRREQRGIRERKELKEENNLRETKNNIRDYFNDDIKEEDYDNEENDIEDNAEANIADGMEESFSYLRDREFPEEILLELREYLLTSSNARFFQSKDVIREEVEKYFAERLILSNGIEVGTKKKIIVFVGPTGVGKTTTIPKIAAQYMKSGKKVSFVTIDNYRIAAVDQLQRYASIMKVPFTSASTPEALRAEIRKMDNSSLLFIDTMGRSPKGAEDIVAMSKYFTTVGRFDMDIQLVMSATAKYKDALKILNGFNTQGRQTGSDPVNIITRKLILCILILIRLWIRRSNRVILLTFSNDSDIDGIVMREYN